MITNYNFLQALETIGPEFMDFLESHDKELKQQYEKLFGIHSEISFPAYCFIFFSKLYKLQTNN